MVDQFLIHLPLKILFENIKLIDIYMFSFEIKHRLEHFQAIISDNN